MTKAQLRQKYLYGRDQMGLKESLLASTCIMETVLGRAEYKKAALILIYVGVKSEVDTIGIIEESWRLGKSVAVPKTYKGGRMAFYELKSLDELSLTPFGILEPAGDGYAVVPDKESLCILPGVAFDLQMNRLGYGAGFYDRYLMDYPQLFKLALAYESQIADEIPSDDHDVQMDLIITESRVYK